jgi:hypothetical protein
LSFGSKACIPCTVRVSRLRVISFTGIAVKSFKEQKIIDKFTGGINEFWQDTTKSFNQCADALERDWQRYLNHLREITSPKTDSRERIEEIIKILEQLQNFFQQIS